LPLEPPNQDFSRLEQLFDQALELSAHERELFLRAECGDDTQLFERLRSLLAAHDSEEEVSDARSKSAAEALPLHRRLGPYEVESLLGRGGMGAVYLAHRADGQYEKKVAIKIVDLPLATEAFFDRFRQERQILAGLDHPNIARLLDGGVSDDGILFLVMEYVEGIRIDEYCRSHQLTLKSKLDLFIAVCGAVQFAHQNLVVHRDLKPDNVLVSADGTPHLLDFGTAKLMSRDGVVETRGLTREGFLSFTPEYASPEQVLGRPVTTASDTYSLGVLLFQILTGHLPYELNEFTVDEMIRIICEQPPGTPTSADNTFPDADLEAILSKALRKEPGERYQTAEQFAADAQACLDHQPVSARKGNLRYHVAKFVRRNRLALSLASVLAITLVAGVAAVAWQAHAARVAERASEASANDLSQLSDTLLSELDDAIKQLPGSTGVQQVLVARVLEHLDRMAKNPRSNTLTQVSLANAYTRLGNLQANPYEQNLGDIPGALHSLDSAMTITRPLAAAHPRDPSILLALARAQDARGEILSFADDSAGAAQSLDASVHTYDQLLATSAATPQLYFEAGSVIDTLGDVMGQDTGFGDAEAALRNYRIAITYNDRARTLDPNFMRARRGLVSMQMKVGNVELDSEPAAALADFRLALDKLNALPQQEQKRLDMTRLRALLLRKQGVALSELGDYTTANPLFEQASAIYHGIAAADPKDARALGDLDRLLTNETLNYETAADPKLATSPASAPTNLAAAEKIATEHIEVLDHALQLSPHSIGLKQQLASVTIQRDALHATLHPLDPPQLQRDREALDLLRAAASDPKASPLQLDLAFHAFTEAAPSSLRDTAFALRCAERGTDLTHQKASSWLLSLAQAYRLTGNETKAKAAAREGLALLPDNPANQAFCLRRLLQSEAR
jgi:serine/threonine protein kinase